MCSIRRSTAAGVEALRSYLLAALLLTSLPAHAEQVIFRGTMTFTAAANCAYQTAGSHYGSMYTPRYIGDNGAHSVITMVNDLNAAALDLANYEFDQTYRAVTVTAVGASGYTTGAKVRVASRYPTSMTTSTRYVWLTGQIRYPWDDPGTNGKPCAVTFEASYVRD